MARRVQPEAEPHDAFQDIGKYLVNVLEALRDASEEQDTAIDRWLPIINAIKGDE